jgi:hypothetical protein
MGVAGIKELNIKISQLLANSSNHTEMSLPYINQSNLQLSSENPVDSLLKRLPLSVQNLHLDQLHLDIKTHNALVKVGITTIKGLSDANNSYLGSIEGFHSGSLGKINGSLIALLNSIKNENEVNWFQYWKAQGIKILPSICISQDTLDQIFENLPKIIEEILQREENEKSWIVIQRRFGLGETKKLTLDEIGSVFSITRERVRQIEDKSLNILREILVEQHYAGKSYQVHPAVHQLIQTLQGTLEKEPSKLLLENKLLKGVCQNFNIDPEKVKSSLIFILTLTGAQYIEIVYPNSVPIWGYAEPPLRQVLESGIKRLDDFLTRETISPQTEIDILVRLNKGARKSEKLTLAQLTWLIDLCTSIERRNDNLVWGKFECLKGRGNQVERILIESGSPMRIADIARQINNRLVPQGQHRVTEENLSNQIIDDRFIAIGRSGIWGLKSWSHIDTKSILTLMEECLIAYNKPSTVEEIFTYVSERRPVSRRSVLMYLINEKDLFVKTGLTTWALAKWSDVAKTNIWDTEEVAEFIANIFRSHKTKELSYTMLKEALMDKASVNAKQAQGLLNSNPVIKTRTMEVGEERIAIFQSNYKAILAQTKLNTSRQKVSLRQKIEEKAYDILRAASDNQMPMAELAHHLQKQLESPISTIYNYLRSMDSLELIDVPNSRTKICRLGDMQRNNNSIPLRQRVSESIKNILEDMPDKQISLPKLLALLQKEYNCPKSTIYHYIAGLDYIEKIDVPNSNAKMCRMRGPQRSDLFPQIQNIADATLREKVERALPFLTEENVDIGLFLLSKEFEATLKTYLVKASTRGKLAILPPGKGPDKWNLNGMIDCAKDNGIITDHATFHYLRQARNDRAHGTMPSSAERKVLIKHVQYIAGLYIDYIKILDDLSQSL